MPHITYSWEVFCFFYLLTNCGEQSKWYSNLYFEFIFSVNVAIQCYCNNEHLEKGIEVTKSVSLVRRHSSQELGIFIFYIFILIDFLDRKEEGGKREREKHQCEMRVQHRSTASCMPQVIQLAVQAWALTRSGTCKLSMLRWQPTHWATLARVSLAFLLLF